MSTPKPLFALLLAFAAAPAMAAPPATFDGHWVNEEWLKRLESTKSPVSSADVSLVAILVDDTPEGRQLSVTSFHEALNYKLLRVEKAGRNALALVVDSHDDATEVQEKLRFDFDRAGKKAKATLWVDGPMTYVRLPGPIADTVNRIVIAGRYVDQKGESWAFGENGQADFGGKKGTFEISLDTFEMGCDNFSFVENGKDDEVRTYGFRRLDGGKTLGLFDLVEDSEDFPVDCAAEPLYKLTPAKP